ncbi:hypothetical protein MIR68_007887 [Amoeboaphelidium protococcarum]|nr:hypothetical protein MIR68_007887 [Amoeboaphelidium protococcarum]
MNRLTFIDLPCQSVPIRHIKAASKDVIYSASQPFNSQSEDGFEVSQLERCILVLWQVRTWCENVFLLAKAHQLNGSRKEDAFIEQEVDQWQEVFEGHEDAPPQIDMEIDNLNELYSSRYESEYLSGSAIRDLLCTGQNTDTVSTEFAQSVGNRPELSLGKINREEVAVCFDSGSFGALISLKDAKKCGLTVLSGDFSCHQGQWYSVMRWNNQFCLATGHIRQKGFEIADFI